MADLIAYQSGNWTGATTWKGVSAGSGAKQATITNATASGTSDVASSNFTIGNATVVEGVLVHCKRNSTTGTVTVGIYDGTTLQRDVTVNVSDLPSDQSWVFFKFATTFTATASSTYNVRVRSSTASSTTFYTDSTAANWARYVRTSTTATPAAADVTFICDELTGAGTKNDIEVTMDSTSSATSYGECNIGQGGVLAYGTSAFTNYILDLSGNMNVWAGGTLNIGTASLRIPWSSSAVLEFTMGTTVLYGVEAKNASTVNLFGANSDSVGNPITTKTLLTADAASGQTVIDVSSTAGWAANTVIALASTTRTQSQSEKATVQTVNSGTRATLTANLTYTHHGTGLYVGEVVNLTRNVKVRGTSASLCAYVNCSPTSSFTASYAEFYWLGSSSLLKYGIFAQTSSAGAFSMNFCSVYDGGSGGDAVRLNGSTGSCVVEDCVMFFNQGVAPIRQDATSGTPSIQRNYIVATTGVVNVSDLGGTIKDNRFGGCGVTFSEQGATIGTIKDNVQHSASIGFLMQTSCDCFGTFENLTTWRNSTAGLQAYCGGYTVLGLSSYHNVQNLEFGTIVTVPIIFKSCTFNGGSGASLAAGGAINFQSGQKIVFDECSFGATTTHSSFITARSTQFIQDATFRKCTVADTVTITNQSNLRATQEVTSAIRFDKFNNTAGSHRSYKRYGYTASDQTTYRTAAPSQALVPNGGSGNKLPSGSKKLQVKKGSVVSVTAYVYKSATYNGNQPRMVVRANTVAGIVSDTVLATASGSTGSWLTLTGQFVVPVDYWVDGAPLQQSASSAEASGSGQTYWTDGQPFSLLTKTDASVSDSAIVEVYVDCDGTAGTVYVDDWSKM